MPSFTRRSEETTASEDRNADGRIDERDERADRPVADSGPVTVREQVDDRGDRRPTTATATDVDNRRGANTADTTVDTDADARREPDDGGAHRSPDASTAERTVAVAPARPRPRASLLATLGLITGVAAALLVLSGVLAGYGVALGVVGLLLAIGGVSATGKRHIAGKTDALIGIALSFGAVIIGALALTGALSWLTTETDKVEQFRQWLDAQFSAIV